MPIQDLTPLGAPALALGLFGGAHCAGMCGGVMSAVMLRRTGPAASILAGYNAGRIVSYVAAGMLAGGLGAALAAGAEMVSARAAVHVLAQIMLLLAGLALAGQGRVLGLLEGYGAVLWRPVAPLASRMMSPRGFGGAFGMGALWGWVPCGLVYSALALAVASGDLTVGGLTMLAFGAGTLPAMLFIGAGAGKLRAVISRPAVRLTAGGMVALTGVLGLVRTPGFLEGVSGGLLCLG